MGGGGGISLSVCFRFVQYTNVGKREEKKKKEKKKKRRLRLAGIEIEGGSLLLGVSATVPADDDARLLGGVDAAVFPAVFLVVVLLLPVGGLREVPPGAGSVRVRFCFCFRPLVFLAAPAPAPAAVLALTLCAWNTGSERRPLTHPGVGSVLPVPDPPEAGNDLCLAADAWCIYIYF